MRNVMLICRARLMGGLRRGKLRMALYALGALFVLAFAALFEGGTLYLMREVGAAEFFPIALAAVSAAFALATSMAVADGQLGAAKDHDIVLALPVSRMAVAASRMLSVYSLNLPFQLAIWLPGGVLWAVMMRPGWSFYALYPLMALCAPLIPMALGSALGLLAVRIATWFHSVRVVALVLALFGMTLYLAAVMTLDFDALDLMRIGDALRRWAYRLYPPVRWIQAGMTGESPALGALFVACSASVTALFTAIYARCFLKIHALMTARREGRRFRMVGQRRGGVMRALFAREMRRYFASNAYVFNTAFGPFLSMVLLIYVRIRTPEAFFQMLELPVLQPAMELVLPLIVAFMLGTACTTGASISLEGKAFWILRMLPVRPRQIVAAKVLCNLALVMPVLAVDGCLMISMFHPTPVGALLLFATPALLLLFTALLGMLVNLRWNRLDWSNEAVVVKRSAGIGVPVLCSTFLALGAAILAGALVSMGRSAGWVRWAFPLLLLAADAALAALLYGRSEALMKRIQP